MKRTNIAVIAGLIFLSACSSNSNTEDSSSSVTPETETTEAAVAPSTDEAVVNINAGDDMKFDLYQIKVKEGQKVKLTLTHTGKQPKTAMGHNFILLTAGVSVADFSGKAIQAAATDYIPASEMGNIIAHTKLLGGGESDTIEFTAPAKGSYNFLCSFPGHSAMMKGKFIVE